MRPIIAGLLVSLALAAQQPGAFEVATIKPSDCLNPGGSLPGPGRIELHCRTIESLIQMSYATLGQLRVIGGPRWISTDMFDISGKTEGAASIAEMTGQLIRDLLESRLQLKTHRESRELPAYFLMPAKNGFQGRATKEGECSPIDPERAKRGDFPENPCGKVSSGNANGNSVLEMHGVVMVWFAATLSRNVDRPVLDRTGLNGMYEMRLEFAPDTPTATSDDRGPSIFTALQEQLGLRLVPDKGPVDVLVIDRIARPSEN